MELDRSASYVRRALAIGLALAALASATGSLGNLSRALNGLLAVVSLLGLAVLLFELPPVRPLRVLLVLGLMGSTLPFVSRGGSTALLTASLFFLALSEVGQRAKGLLITFSLTALFFAIYCILVANVPAVWYAEQRLAIYFSWFVGAGLMLGPTALGLPILVLFGFFALSTCLLALRGSTAAQPFAQGATGSELCGKQRVAAMFVIWLLALAAALVAYVWLQPLVASWLIAHWPAPITSSPVTDTLPNLTYLEFPLLLFVLLWTVSMPIGIRIVLQPPPLSVPQRSGKWAVAGLALLALSIPILTLDPPRKSHPGSILIHDAGHIEWGRPVFGQYGAHSGGAFGLLPDYLTACGYQTRTGPLTDENLQGARAVVLVNLPQNLSPDEKGRLLAFVQAGGGLIVWGEHTGLGRIRGPINDLLADLPGAPIQLKFDSAVPVRQGWAEGLTLLPHPALYEVQDPLDMVIAVGASLAIRPPARPLIVGRFGHSDAGDATNPARNYVGDMRYNPGERLGDLVLAAEVAYGQGHIAVVGDTTPLGSVNLMTTLPFHARLLKWITADPLGGWGWLFRNSWLGGLLLLAAAACLVQARSQAVLASAIVALGLGFAFTSYVNIWAGTPSPPQGPLAYLDVSHQEGFDRLLWEDTSVGGLDYNLVRNGMLPLLSREINAELLSQAELLVIVAPGQSFSRHEIDTIAEWVENGGQLLLSAGWEESEASSPLLSFFGLRVDNIPLGPAEAALQTGTVRFHEAWPVLSEWENSRTIVSAYGYPVVVYQPWGEGGVILIGDSEFLLGATLESDTSYQLGNILLLRRILSDALGGQRP